MIIRTTRTKTWDRVISTESLYSSYEFNNLEEAIERLEHVGVDIDVHHGYGFHKIEESKSETSEKAFPPDNHSNFPDQNFPDQDFRTEEEDRGQ